MKDVVNRTGSTLKKLVTNQPIAGETIMTQRITDLSIEEIDDLVSEAIDAACAPIQERLGAMFGDVAGMFFSDPENRKPFYDYIEAELLDARLELENGTEQSPRSMESVRP